MPLASDLGDQDHLSGLPWGGLNIPHMVQRGHDSTGSRHGDQYDAQQQQQYYDPQQMGGYEAYSGYEAAGGSGGGDDRYFTTASSAASSSPSHFSYDVFSGDGGSQTGSGTRY